MNTTNVDCATSGPLCLYCICVHCTCLFVYQEYDNKIQIQIQIIYRQMAAIV